MVSLLLQPAGMGTERTVRLGYRGHLIEVTLERRPDGSWTAKWMVFATRPFLPKRQVVVPTPHPSEERARNAAVTAALRWIDAEMPAPAPTAEGAGAETAGVGPESGRG
jgi:hypothetical protein